MVSNTDNSRFLAMVKNRPSISLIPAANTRILSQKVGTNILFAGLILGFFGIFGYRRTQELFSPQIFNTRKAYSFKADPYSMSVSCTYRDVPYKPQGF